MLPALLLPREPLAGSPFETVLALALAAAAWAIASRPGSNTFIRSGGATLAALMLWLLEQASYPGAAILIAPALGLCAALAGARLTSPPTRETLSLPVKLMVVVGVSALLALIAVAISRHTALIAGGAVIAGAAVSGMVTPEIRPPARSQLTLAAGATLAVVAITAYVGATTPSAGWFGSLVQHGPRDGDAVAITFDDGPDPPYTLAIRDILDEYGAKATFFSVGKALAARPDVSRALLDDGQLLGNHSYHHDAVRWLDPRYPELDKTEDVFRRELAVCPALFRPPHGTHTPFMAHAVGVRDMTMVTWDVSAKDWATDDGQVVARRVLKQVKPGSIILLHDGLDGRIGADRSVILVALPIILDGLRARGLRPVTLDVLLGIPGYREDC